MTTKRELKPETLAARAGGFVDPMTGAIVPPIQPSTTYARNDEYVHIGGRSYSRDENPGYDQAEAVLARLEGGEGALLFSSGMGAISAVFQALATGDHVVVPADVYYGTPKWLREVQARWGLAFDGVPATDLDALTAAIRPGRTKLVLVETPANPTWAVTDIAAAAEIAHGAGALLAVDSSAATPVLTRPIEHGADLVVHSATKYLNGHSDVIAGAVVTARKDDMWRRIAAVRALGGAVLGPFEAWLLLRGMRTLFVRVRRSSSSAQAIAEHFAGHPRLAEICYPGLPGFAGHAVARRQMTGGFGGMMSLRFAGGPVAGGAAAMAAIRRLELIARATSLGGVESLIEHRASVEGPASPVTPDLLRLSVGLEAPEDLIADLEQAIGG
jgi:cystathionine gamma-synthase